MDTETNPSASDPSLSPPPTKTASLPIAADRPDAAPQPGDDRVRIACHVLALLAIVALLAYCVIWIPDWRSDIRDVSSAGAAPSAVTFDSKGGT